MKLLNFSASWCAPCKMFKPVLKEVTDTLAISVEWLDIEKNEELTNKYSIRSVPTTIILDDAGYQIDIIVGTINKHELLSKLKGNTNG